MTSDSQGTARVCSPLPPVAEPPGLRGLRAAPALRVALLSGGDERLVLDPRTGRNRYGIPVEGVAGEVWFSSSTASALSPHGHAAAAGAFARLVSGQASGVPWMTSIRDRLAAMFGIDGTEVVLTASGTEAELVVLALARQVLRRPLSSIVVAPQETGSGVVLAAGGRHFLASASNAPVVHRGTTVAGFGAGAIVDAVDIRSPEGEPLDPHEVEDQAGHLAEAALRAGRDVLLHVLDCSKTGLAGMRPQVARALAAALGDHAVVAVDACQLRCPADTVRRHLRAGFLVMISGSKFAGGPPFSGAVLVPPGFVERLQRIALPAGLASYCALHDWPAALRERIDGTPFTTLTNIGLGLRWEAALAELDRYAAIEPRRRAAIAGALAARIAGAVDAVPGLQRLPPPSSLDRMPSIVPVITRGRDGAALSAKAIHTSLMTPAERGGDRRVFHVGQPVVVGSEAALRLCIGAPHISDAADRMAEGHDLGAALAPVMDDLGALLATWSTLRERLDRPAPARRSA